LAKFQELYRRKYSGLSPIGETPGDILAKVQWTFAIGESHIGENLIGEIPEPHNDTHRAASSYQISLSFLTIISNKCFFSSSGYSHVVSTNRLQNVLNFHAA
jgi:hypothetical protein